MAASLIITWPVMFSIACDCDCVEKRWVRTPELDYRTSSSSRELIVMKFRKHKLKMMRLVESGGHISILQIAI